MGYDGSGNFSRAMNFTADRDAGIHIRADRMDTEFNNFSVGMNAVLLRNGVAAMTGTLAMGMNRIAGLPDGTAFVPAASFATDATTGVFSSGFGKIALSAGGTQRLEANSTGVNVAGTLAVTGALTFTTPLAITSGGSGASTAAGARTNFGLAIGTDVQAFNANLSAFAGLSLIADRLPYANGTGTLALATFTAAGRALVDDADAAAQRVTLGLGTAATQTVGTSGATVPLLNGANTWSGAQNANAGLSSTGFAFSGTGVHIGFSSAIGNLYAYNTGGATYLNMLYDAAKHDFAISGVPKMTLDATGNLNLVNALALAQGGTGSTTAAGARTNFGLGTAAVQNTGTSGANVPLLNGANTFGATQAFADITLTGGIQLNNAQYVSGKTSGGTSTRMLGISSGNVIFLGSVDAAASSLNINVNGTNWGVFDGTGLVVTGTMNATTAVQENSVPLGYKNLVSQTGGLVAGKVFSTAAGFTVNTGAAADTTYAVYNNSGSPFTITQGAGLTMRLAGTTTTGSRTLAARGFATIWAVSTTEVVVSGNVT